MLWLWINNMLIKLFTPMNHTYIVLLSDASVRLPLSWGWCLPLVKAQPDTQHKAGRAPNHVLLPPRCSRSPLAPAPSSSSWWTSAHPTPLLSVSDAASASPGLLHPEVASLLMVVKKKKKQKLSTVTWKCYTSVYQWHRWKSIDNSVLISGSNNLQQAWTWKHHPKRWSMVERAS